MSFRLPFTFIITGMIGFVLFQVLNLSDLASWIMDHPRSTVGWFRVHLLVLGWASMIAMGAVYQLINVVLQSKIYSEKLGFVHYAFFSVGAIGLLFGFQQGDFRLIALFATTAFIGIVLFAVNMAVTLVRAKQWNAITVSTACAAAYLLLTGLTGMAMGLNFRFGWWSGIHDRIFHAHMWLGTVGWFGLLIIGFSFKMLPMFYLAHGYPAKLQKWIVALWNAAVLLGAAGFFADAWVAVWVSLLLLVAAIAAYNAHIRQILAHKHKPNPGEGIKWSIVSAITLLVAGVILLVAYPFFPDRLLQADMLTLIGWLYIWGFVAMTILAYLSKIVPFLWWTYKYGPQVGKKKIPTMAELLEDRHVRIGMSAIAIGFVILLVGIGSRYAPLVTAGGSILSVASLVYMGLIAKVFTR